MQQRAGLSPFVFAFFVLFFVFFFVGYILFTGSQLFGVRGTYIVNQLMGRVQSKWGLFVGRGDSRYISVSSNKSKSK